MKQSYGLSAKDSWLSLCLKNGFDGYPYPCAISNMTFANGILNITVQESLTKAEGTTYAKYALNFLCATDASTAQNKAIEWVDITDTSGGVRGQMQASSNTMCQMNK